ncbi:hypothetical protein C5167_013710 [Papaver somniferum]|uniref:Cyclin-dependent kinase inhibitor n=1 Tax=Papaver somniferum TaxID=3469 RepID=A0A4Y7J149_PAPSO|nr:cyclin-dependent kinase inhibitor 7-like [Papaver somniferum]RZC54864.1 hypothetical protein C5167_013710 [Papaver somniferum]
MAELSNFAGKTRVGTLNMSTTSTAAATITRSSSVLFNGELLGYCSSSNQKKRKLIIIKPELMVSSPALSLSTNKCVHTVMSCSVSCINNRSCDLVTGEKRNLMLRDFVEGEKQEGFEFENNPLIINHQSDSESKGLEMSSEANSKSRKLSDEKMPTETEIKDFFSAFEKQEHKRFLEKYNYDITKDVPLEGRYEWISLKP